MKQRKRLKTTPFFGRRPSVKDISEIVFANPQFPSNEFGFRHFLKVIRLSANQNATLSTHVSNGHICFKKSAILNLFVWRQPPCLRKFCGSFAESLVVVISPIWFWFRQTLLAVVTPSSKPLMNRFCGICGIRISLQQSVVFSSSSTPTVLDTFLSAFMYS